MRGAEEVVPEGSLATLGESTADSETGAGSAWDGLALGTENVVDATVTLPPIGLMLNAVCAVAVMKPATNAVFQIASRTRWLFVLVEKTHATESSTVLWIA
jgi:hypothetical protein